MQRWGGIKEVTRFDKNKRTQKKEFEELWYTAQHQLAYKDALKATVIMIRFFLKLNLDWAFVLFKH